MLSDIAGILGIGMIIFIVMAVRAKKKKTGKTNKWILYSVGCFFLSAIAGGGISIFAAIGILGFIGMIVFLFKAYKAKKNKTGMVKKWLKYAGICFLVYVVLLSINNAIYPSPEKDSTASKQHNSILASTSVDTSSNSKKDSATVQKKSDTKTQSNNVDTATTTTTTQTVTAATTSTPAETTQPQQCRQDPLAGVYHPSRLKIVSNCKTVSGTVVSIKNESDDDYHINLQLDSPDANLINDKNVSQEHGALVVEVIPMDRPNISKPTVGEKLTVTGAYVVDGEHGWMEIHPAWIVNNQGTVNYTAEAAQKSVTEGICGNGDKDCEGGSTTTSNNTTSSSAAGSSTSSTATDTVKITNVTSTVSKGSEASVTAQVKPGASASITVYYNSGPSNAAGLGTKNADGNGTVSWQWKVGTKTAPGTYQIVVESNGQSATTNFTVN